MSQKQLKVTVSGELGSGKTALIAELMNYLTELGLPAVYTNDSKSDVANADEVNEVRKLLKARNRQKGKPALEPSFWREITFCQETLDPKSASIAITPEIRNQVIRELIAAHEAQKALGREFLVSQITPPCQTCRQDGEFRCNACAANYEGYNVRDYP